MPHIEFLADRTEAGKTVSAVLRQRFGLTWTQAQRLIERGHVRVAGFACSDPALRVKKGNRMWVREGTVEIKASGGVSASGGVEESRSGGVKAPKAAATGNKPASPTKVPTAKRPIPGSAPERGQGPHSSSPPLLHPSTLVYADDAVAVVDKPAGLTTMRHAAEAAEFGPRGQKFLPATLADLLPGLLGRPGAKVIPVHRIDRDTSGLVAFALTRKAADRLAEQFRGHSVERRYLALTRGTPAGGRVASVLVRDRGDGRRGSSPDPAAAGGKRAVTRVKVLERLGPFALVECRLETGRTHQVRIHLGEGGTPLCGETVYDRPVNGKPAADGSGAARPLLHAARLGFVHPDTGDPVRWDAPPPADFAAVLDRLRAATPGETWDV